MNVLLLGNGFDIYYHLPTKYSNFLNVANYLINGLLVDIHTVGDILGNPALFEKDKDIAISYEKYQKLYDSMNICENAIKEFCDYLQNNIWFSYLTSSFNKDVGWIDFEKEIAFVLSCLECILPTDKTRIYVENKNYDAIYVIGKLGFLFNEDIVDGQELYTIKPEFCFEYPLGSNSIKIDKRKIVSVLQKELDNLAKALKLYLAIFVEPVCDLIHKNQYNSRIAIFNNIDNVVTFNYTNTYEKLYFNKKTFHIHGNVNDQIILGVNPDKNDCVGSIDTTFIPFKKYYQRTVHGTDNEYLKWIHEFGDFTGAYHLFVMGHSLDVTDSDILKNLFEYAREVTILFHSEDAKKTYIENLVALFGDDGLLSLRKDKNLKFLSLDSDFSKMALDMARTAFEDVVQTIVI